jgi:hypothetical protein
MGRTGTLASLIDKEITVTNSDKQQENKRPADDNAAAGKRRPADQGGHQGQGGHGGQQSGGMGGMHGGDLHDVGTGQSGMTGRGGMGGNDNDHQKPGAAGQQSSAPGNEQRAEAGGHEAAEIQQSAQREGMGQHRHSGRGNEQAIDETDEADLGRHDASAADAEKNREADQ